MSNTEVEWDTDELKEQEVEVQGNMTLKLGDIIEFLSPSNLEYHQKAFFIEYIDDSEIEILDVINGFKHTLTMYESGQLTDESITQINLLSRAPEEGYVRQNGLLTGTWINVHFGGEIPTVITGEITNVDEDMIEIITYPDTDVIYLNFEYKGIPKNLPIEKIEIREKPKSIAGSLRQMMENASDQNYDEGEFASMSISETGEIAIKMPDKPRMDPNFNDTMKELIFNMKDIVFGEEEEINVRTEVKQSEQRYGIDIQLNDLLDELLSTIPENRRSEQVMRRIYTIVRRFKELREKFSTFDENGNVSGYNNFDAAYKPLVEHMRNMDCNLRWILPVVKQQTKLYNVDEGFDADAVSKKSRIEDLLEMDGIKRTFTDYSTYYENINDNMTPFEQTGATHVKADLETIVENLDNYYSHVINNANKAYRVATRRFVMQKYNLGLSKMHKHIMKSGKSVYLRGPMTAADKMDAKSVIMLPDAVVDFSRVDLPGTSVLDRVNRSANWFYYHRFLKARTNKSTLPAAKAVDYEATDQQFLAELTDFDREGAENMDYEQFLENVIPRSRSIIYMMRDRVPNPYNFNSMISFFEPFLIYPDNITYSAKTLSDKRTGAVDVKQGGSYQEIRFHVKEMVKKYKATMASKGAEFGEMGSKKYEKEGKAPQNTLYRVLRENNEFMKMMEERYGGKTGSETLIALMNSDSGSAYMATVSLMLGFLFKPDLSRLIAAEESSVFKSKSCATRSIAKKYKSVRDMQKDNDTEDIFFDKEYDDTPYDIIAQYQEDKGKMLPDKFLEYFKMVLVEKHDANPETVDDLASNLIMGKRRIQSGNYAMLEIVPSSKDADSSKDIDVSAEENARKKTSFYIRRKNNWIREDVDDDTFCNLSPGCYLNEDKKKKTCDDAESTRNRLHAKDMGHMSHMDTVIDLTTQDLQNELKARAKYYIDLLKKIQWIKSSAAKQHSIYAYMMGAQVVESTIIVSPYIKLRDYILSQSDFPKKHADVLRFRDHFCREAVNSDTVAESEHWLYCVDTNSKLLPKFLYDLAYSYVVSNNYEETMDRICRHNGKLSDDLDSIVDKHSGYIIRSIDFIDEDEYNEAGFKVTHADLMSAGAGERLQTEGTADAVGADANIEHVLGRKTKAGKKVFEDPNTQHIYNIASSLCEYMAIDFNVVEDRIMPVSIEFVKNLDSVDAYKAKQEKAAKKNIKIASYQTYLDQNKIYYTACMTFVAIQTSIPSFTPRKTFPGCIFSFGGYPLEGGEDITNAVGLKYVACVIESIKTSVEPWNSISNQKRDMIVQRLMELMTKRVVLHADVADLYLRKKKHMAENPDSYQIPKEHDVSKWTQFQPPIVAFSVVKSPAINGLSAEFREELSMALKKGSKSQREMLGTVYQKIIANTYGVIESVNSIVAIVGKEVLLRAGSIIFLENACCEDAVGKKGRALDYFTEKNPDIVKFIETARAYSNIIHDSRALCIAPYLVKQMASKKKLEIGGEGHTFSEEQIYSAFIHYCKLSVDAPVPDDLLAFYPEKPAMDLKGSMDLQQTIDHLKKMGHNHNVKALRDLMQRVAHRNKVQVDLSEKSVDYGVPAFADLIEHLSDKKIIETPLANHLSKLIEHPKETDKLNALKRYLMRANREMLEIINKNIVEFSSMKKMEKQRISKFLASVGTWAPLGDAEIMRKSSQYLKNCVHFVAKVAPAMLLGIGSNATIGMHNAGSMKHWELSQNHEATIVRNITEYFKGLNSFKKDAIVCQFFRDMEPMLININLFAQNVPFETLFDREATQLLYIYIYYSVYHDLIIASNDDEYVKVEMAKVKQMRRDLAADAGDEIFVAASEDPSMEEGDPEPLGDEYNILVGKKQDFKKQICGLLAILIEMDMQNKAIINVNYDDLSDKIYKASKMEKKTITDRFETMSIEERSVENAMKQYKMGAWNAGEEKGLFRYDRKTYDKEVTGQMMANTANEGANVADLNAFDEANADADADREAYDIGNLGENFEDGAYYEEDMEREN